MGRQRLSVSNAYFNLFWLVWLWILFSCILIAYITPFILTEGTVWKRPEGFLSLPALLSEWRLLFWRVAKVLLDRQVKTVHSSTTARGIPLRQRQRPAVRSPRQYRCRCRPEISKYLFDRFRPFDGAEIAAHAAEGIVGCRIGSLAPGPFNLD